MPQVTQLKGGRAPIPRGCRELDVAPREGSPAGIKERGLSGGDSFPNPGRLSCGGEAVPGAPEQGEMQGDATVSRHNPSLHLSSKRAKGLRRGLWGEE